MYLCMPNLVSKPKKCTNCWYVMFQRQFVVGLREINNDIHRTNSPNKLLLSSPFVRMFIYIIFHLIDPAQKTTR